MEIEYIGLIIDTEYTPGTDDHLREGPGPSRGHVTGTAIYVPDGYTYEDCEEAWDIWQARLVTLGMTAQAAEADARASHASATANGGRITGNAADYFLSCAASFIEDSLDDAERNYCPEEEGLNI